MKQGPFSPADVELHAPRAGAGRARAGQHPAEPGRGRGDRARRSGAGRGVSTGAPATRTARSTRWRTSGGRAPGATIYVNLEPCCHTGRTGPCTSALIAAGDPARRRRLPRPQPARRRARRAPPAARRHPRRRRLPGGRVPRGEPRLLRLGARAAAAGDAEGGGDAGRLHRRASAARRPGSPARRRARRAHQLRAAHDAILVGAGTVRADDPQLTVRLPGAASASASSKSAFRGQTPLRVVLDGRLHHAAAGARACGAPAAGPPRWCWGRAAPSRGACARSSAPAPRWCCWPRGAAGGCRWRACWPSSAGATSSRCWSRGAPQVHGALDRRAARRSGRGLRRAQADRRRACRSPPAAGCRSRARWRSARWRSRRSATIC